MKDYIITSLQAWDISIGSTIKNIALEISKQNRVLYIDTSMNYIEWIKSSKKKSNDKIIQINPQLWVLYPSSPVFPIGKIQAKWLFDKLNYFNNSVIAKEILAAAKKLNFKDYINIIDTDIYRSQYLKELIKPALSIYYCRDYVIGVDYWKKHGTRLEPLIAQKADLVLANSSYFAEKLKPYNDQTYALETGVNLSLYNAALKYDVPQDMSTIPKPIVGYTGTLTTLRLDIELLYHLAQRMENINFVFVGPFEKAFDIHPLHQLPNVYFLGHKPVKELPAYINAFDVCINPQVVNEITYGNYPLKIDEYLAMGKPVVATSTHTMLDIFKDHTYLPTNLEEYIKDLSAALLEANDESKKESRIAFAHTHSWENIVNKIYNIINQFSRAI